MRRGFLERALKIDGCCNKALDERLSVGLNILAPVLDALISEDYRARGQDSTAPG